MQQLDLQSTYLELLLTRQAEQIEAAGYAACAELDNVLHARNAETPSQVIWALRTSTGPTGVLVKDCKTWIERSGVNSIRGVENGVATLNSWFSEIAVSIDQSKAVLATVPLSERNWLLSEIRGRADLVAAHKKIVDAVGVEESRRCGRA